MNAIEPIGALGLHTFEAVAPMSQRGNFVELTQNMVLNVNDSVAGAEHALRAYAAGEQMPTHELMMSMEQAKLSLQIAVEVRNKVVDAYQEMMRMQI